jgi:hypothetical protein
MKAIDIKEEEITLTISKAELGVLSNALNEACNAIEVWEFEKRMGVSPDQARDLLSQLTAIYAKADRQP